MADSYLISGKTGDCVNCENCINACRFSAISLNGNDGIFFPKIDREKCRKCNICLKVCPNSKKEYVGKIQKRYAIGWSRDGSLLQSTSSGGVFQVLARAVVQHGGWVFGTEFSRTGLAEVNGFCDENIQRFSGSKYVKSRVGTAFKKIEELLKTGIPVLFGGTPCQCAALRSYLNKEYRNLYLADIICHGSPEPKVFESYLKYLEKKYGSAVEDVRFRNKDKGWKQGQIEVRFKNGTIMKERFHPRENIYANVFYSNIALTPGCQTCRYHNMDRTGDITLGDFWGYKTHPHIKVNEMGTSVVLINTERGQELLEMYGKEMELFDVEKEIAAANNPPLHEGTPINPLSKVFLWLIDKTNFECAYIVCLQILKWALLPYKVLRKVYRKLAGVLWKERKM